MTYQLTTLSSGLRVASEFVPGVESVAVTVSCGVGARYENDHENGVSHLLEHMAFKGTKTRSAREIAESMDNIGGQMNAYTSMESTVYYAKVLKENMRLAVDILSDILQHSVFDAEEFRREQGVIIQEIAMHHDTPEDLIVDYFDETAFPEQPLGRSILSTEERIASYAPVDVMRYMQKHYQPSRMVLSAAGNIAHENFVALAEEFFSLEQTSPASIFTPATYQGGNKRVPGDFEQLHIIMGLPTVPIHSPDYHTLQVYANILGGGMSSRLFQEVREKRGLAYTVYASGSAYEDVGMMSVYAATNPEKGSELCKVLADQIAQMATSISDSELARARNQLKAELWMARENPQTVANWIGRHLLVFSEYRTLATIIAKIDAVTKADVLRLASDIACGKLTLAALGDASNMCPYETLTDGLAA